MAMVATLILGKKKYYIKQFGQEFKQYQYNSYIRPNLQPQFGHLTFVLDTPEDNNILELMLKGEHTPLIQGLVEICNGKEMPVRRILFNTGFIISYKETFNTFGNGEMETMFTIAAWRMEINKIKLTRIDLVPYWVKAIEPKPKPMKEHIYTPPIPLVRKVKIDGKDKSLYTSGETITLSVVQYNMANISKQDRERVNWIVEIDGKQKVLITRKGKPYKGERISFEIPNEWKNKEVIIMPYLKKPNRKVFVSIKVCKHIDGAILVAKYIVEEIKRNTRSNIAESIRYYASFDEYKKRFEEWRKRNIVGLLLTPPPEPPNLIKAKVLWTERVFTGRPWDHKPKIKKMFSHVAVERTEYSNVKKKMISFKSYYHKYKEYDYFYDVWSNIHYEYLGLSVGFDRKTLLGDADLAQIIDSSGNNSEDAIDDKIAIKIGFSLYEKFGRYAKYLTAQDVLNALDTATMKESKKKHICLK